MVLGGGRQLGAVMACYRGLPPPGHMLIYFQDVEVRWIGEGLSHPAIEVWEFTHPTSPFKPNYV